VEAKEFKAGEFVAIVSDNLEENGLPEGTYLYLAGDTFVRESEVDPYLYRKAFVAARVVDMHIQADEKPFLVTAKNFIEVAELELAALQAVYEEDFGGENE
jgi:hypothetical protein